MAKRINENRFVLDKSTFVYASVFYSLVPSYSQVVGFHYRDFSMSIVVVILIEIFFVLPVRFLMTLIGHYSQSSSVAIGWMQPILAGISFCMIVSSVLSTIYIFVTLKDVGIYLIHSLTRGRNAYLDCDLFKFIGTYCIDHVNTEDDIKEKAALQGHRFNTTSLVTYYFYKYLFLEKYLNSSDQSLVYQRITIKMINLLLIIVLPLFLFFMAQVQLRTLFKCCKPLTIITVILRIYEMMVMISIPGSTRELTRYFVQMTEPWRYENTKKWFRAIIIRMMAYGPLNVYHVTIGSKLDPHVNSEVAIVEAFIIQMIVSFINSLTYCSVIGSLHRSQVYRVDTGLPLIKEYFFISLPAANDYLYSGTLAFLLLFYFSEFIVLTIRISIMIHMIFNCLTDIFPFVAQYKRYIVSTYLILLGFTCFFFFYDESKDAELIWLGESQILPIWISLVIFSIFTLWFYSVVRLCDDFHFKSGYVPSFFWKATLWPLPFTLFLTLAVLWKENYKKLNEKFSGKIDNAYVIAVAIQLLYAVPFCIRTIYEVMRYILYKKLLWLVIPQERWGDPDPKERYARKKYPPRLETKIRRRFDYCKHRCLRYNKVLHAIDRKEYDTRAVLLNVPQELIEEKKYIYSIIKSIQNKSTKK